MHKAILKAMRAAHLAKKEQVGAVPQQRKIVAKVTGTSTGPLACPIQTAKSYVVDANLRNPSNGKEIQGVEFLIDTGCHFAVVIPAFVADQIGLDETTLVKVFGITNADGSAIEAPTHNVVLVINGIPIRTTAAVSGTTGEKALIGAELLSLFDLQIRGDSCRLTLIASK